MSETGANAATVDVAIRFPQVDPAGIVFYPRYFEMVLRYFPDIAFSQTPAGIKTQFLKPNRFGDRIELGFEAGRRDDDWFVSGKMEGAEYFSMTPISTGDPADLFQASKAAAFETKLSAIGEWCADGSGHMHLSRYFEYLNMAIEEWFEAALELPFAELHVDRKIGIPTVQFDTRVYSLPKVGDNVSIRLWPVKIGGRAMTFMSYFMCGDRCLVANEQVVVFVRMLDEGYESINIPDYIRSAFQSQLDDMS